MATRTAGGGMGVDEGAPLGGLTFVGQRFNAAGERNVDRYQQPIFKLRHENLVQGDHLLVV